MAWRRPYQWSFSMICVFVFQPNARSQLKHLKDDQQRSIPDAPPVPSTATVYTRKQHTQVGITMEQVVIIIIIIIIIIMSSSSVL